MPELPEVETMVRGIRPFLERRDYHFSLAQTHDRRVVIESDNKNIAEGFSACQIPDVPHVEQIEAAVAEDYLLAP